MKLVRMKPGQGDVLLAEGDPAVAEDEERLVEEFRRHLDASPDGPLTLRVPAGYQSGVEAIPATIQYLNERKQMEASFLAALARERAKK
jgi:hypothetical protein